MEIDNLECISHPLGKEYLAL